LAFATFLNWRSRIGACGVGACGFWRLLQLPRLTTLLSRVTMQKYTSAHSKPQSLRQTQPNVLEEKAFEFALLYHLALSF